MRIDSHVHVWTMGTPPFTHNDGMTTQRPDYPGLVENLIRYMDLNEIDRTVLIQCMYHGYDNRYMCDCLRRYPDRLHGVALIDLLKPDAPETLARLHRDHRVQGMRLYPIKDRDASWLSDPGQHALWETAQRLGVPFTWFGTLPSDSTAGTDVAAISRGKCNSRSSGRANPVRGTGRQFRNFAGSGKVPQSFC